MNKLASLPLVLLFILPLCFTLFFVLASGFDPAGWAALMHHPQLVHGLELSFVSGISATGISLLLALLIAANYFERGQLSKLGSPVGMMLAVPHLAFAIGFGFLIMPSGLLARILAHIFDWVEPPLWATTHDAYGLALTVALIAKESVFLLFVLVNVLSREDISQSFDDQRQSAISLEHSSLSSWLRLFIPQLLPHMLWPLIIVFIYSSTVVDMSLVLGPTQPPVFADVIWVDINSADPLANARGAAGAVFISMIAAGLLTLCWAIVKLVRPLMLRWITRGSSHNNDYSLPLVGRVGVGVARSSSPLNEAYDLTAEEPPPLIPPHKGEGNFIGRTIWNSLKNFYIFVIATLVVLSFAALWPFPKLVPETLNADAWQNVAAHFAPLLTSLALALSTSVAALIILILWLENVSQKYDRWILVFCLMVLGLPALLIGLGQYQMFLRLSLTGTITGLFLAHLLPVVAYMFIMLNGPYRYYDTKWNNAATALLAPNSKFLMQIKWPMLKAPLLSSLAVGFAVSFAQFVPSQLVAAGRYSTLPMEAVTLSSGSNRPLTAAFALLLMVPPLLIFVLSGIFGKQRWGNA